MGNEIMRRLLQEQWADKPWMRSGWKSRTKEVYEKIGMKRPKKPRGPRKPRRARSQELPLELQLGKARLDAVLWRALAQAKEPQVRSAGRPGGGRPVARLSSEEWESH